MEEIPNRNVNFFFLHYMDNERFAIESQIGWQTEKTRFLHEFISPVLLNVAPSERVIAFEIKNLK